jgi:hypothetical protein
MALRPLVTAALMAPSALAAASPHQRKHVLMILADDYGWADSGWHRQDEIGRKEVLTPTMDGLIKEGLELDRHCACSPRIWSPRMRVIVVFVAPHACARGCLLKPNRHVQVLQPYSLGVAERTQPNTRQRPESRPAEPQPCRSSVWFFRHS